MNYFFRLKQFAVFSLLTASITCLEFCTGRFSENKLNIQYPYLKAEPVSDTYFGKTIIDQYRLLENSDNTTVRQWLLKERLLCDSVLNRISFRDSLQKEIKDAVYSSNIRGGFPRTAGKKLFFIRSYIKEKTQVLFYKDSIDAKEIELFNTAKLNKGNQEYSIDYFEPSFDGKYLAFGLSSNGDEMAVIKIIDVMNKLVLPEFIDRAIYGEPFWIPGKNGFFYNQLKEVKSAADSKTIYEDSKVKLHWINTDSKNDKDVFSRVLNNDLELNAIDFSTFYTFPSSDKVLAFTVHGATPYISLYYAPLKDFTEQNFGKKILWKNVCTSNEKITGFALNKQQLYLLSFKDNPNGSIKKFDLNKNHFSTQTIIEGKDDVLEEMIQTQNSIYIKKFKNGISSMIRIDLATEIIENIELPFNGYVYLKPGFGISPAYLHSSDLFFAMQSWNKEVGVYSYNPVSKKTTKTDLRAQGKYYEIYRRVISQSCPGSCARVCRENNF